MARVHPVAVSDQGRDTVTASEWSKAYRQTRDDMHDAACEIAEAVTAGYGPTDELLRAFVRAKAAYDAVINTKIEHKS